MKARLVPVYFEPGRDHEFDDQIAALRVLLSDQAEILAPVALGEPVPECEAVLFPQILGEGYRRVADFRKYQVPILIITSEFGTVSMWDWEIASYLEAEGIKTIAPYDADQARRICQTLRVKREMRGTKFLVFQDNPGEGCQPSIFKRFYWWEDECTQRIKESFGIVIEKRSYKEFGAAIKLIPDADVASARKDLGINVDGLGASAMDSALRMYIGLKREVQKDPSIGGMGINCLNESRFSDTTPCFAWNLIFEELGVLWACEADTVSLVCKFILNKCLDAPLMMTNIYPFLMGRAALKHEKIEKFPDAAEPENHVLMAHCGYLGVLPRKFSETWSLKPPVLGIVDKNAHAIDARMATGPITLAKFNPTFKKIMVVEGALTGYSQNPGSDCRNGAVIKVPDGKVFMDRLYSHHQILMKGHWFREIEFISRLLGLEVEKI